MSLLLKPLSAKQREQAFARTYAKADLTPYIEALREMEGGVAYAIPVNGTVTGRGMRARLNRAAKQLDLSLRWAKLPKNAPEIIAELA